VLFQLILYASTLWIWCLQNFLPGNGSTCSHYSLPVCVSFWHLLCNPLVSAYI